LKSSGVMYLGWATADSKPKSFEEAIGHDSLSVSFNGCTLRKLHRYEEEYGSQPWTLDDVVGCLIDFENLLIRFTLNGSDLGVAFEGNAVKEMLAEGVMPALSLNPKQMVAINLGEKIFCNMPYGYESVLSASRNLELEKNGSFSSVCLLLFKHQSETWEEPVARDKVLRRRDPYSDVSPATQQAQTISWLIFHMTLSDRLLEAVYTCPVVKETDHPYPDCSHFSSEICCFGVDALAIKFDERCETEEKLDNLSFYEDVQCSKLVAHFSGKQFHNFVVNKDRVTYKWMSDTLISFWGWKFTVFPQLQRLIEPVESHIETLFSIINHCEDFDNGIVLEYVASVYFNLASSKHIGLLCNKEALTRLRNFLKSTSATFYTKLAAVKTASLLAPASGSQLSRSGMVEALISTYTTATDKEEGALRPVVTRALGYYSMAIYRTKPEILEYAGHSQTAPDPESEQAFVCTLSELIANGSSKTAGDCCAALGCLAAISKDPKKWHLFSQEVLSAIMSVFADVQEENMCITLLALIKNLSENEDNFSVLKIIDLKSLCNLVHHQSPNVILMWSELAKVIRQKQRSFTVEQSWETFYELIGLENRPLYRGRKPIITGVSEYSASCLLDKFPYLTALQPGIKVVSMQSPTLSKFTLSFWMYPTSNLGGTNQNLMFYGNREDNSSGLNISIGEDKKICVLIPTHKPPEGQMQTLEAPSRCTPVKV